MLSAVELELFTQLGDGSMTGEEIGERSACTRGRSTTSSTRSSRCGFLERDGDGSAGRYRNTAETAVFLDKDSPTYIGGILEMCNARLYGFWGDLTEALRTGRPQNEVKHTGTAMFEELYSDPARLEQFMGAMAGISAGNFHALAETFDFSALQDASATSAARPASSARSSPAGIRTCAARATTSRPVAPIAERTIAAAGLSDRVTAAAGDFFAEPLPQADVITMGLILHDWNLERKMHLIRSAYDALPEGGAFIVVENLIDDARRENVFGLMMSLNMLIEFGDAFDFTGADFAGWCKEVGFRDVEILPLTGPASAGIAFK